MIKRDVFELHFKMQELDKQINEALANEDFNRATVLAKQREALSEELHVITHVGIDELNSDS